MWLVILILMVIAVIGGIGVHRTNNYENIWGAFYIYGSLFLFLAVILKLVLLVFAIPL